MMEKSTTIVEAIYCCLFGSDVALREVVTNLHRV